MESFVDRGVGWAVGLGVKKDNKYMGGRLSVAETAFLFLADQDGGAIPASGGQADISLT
jgi:hypothetical protein